jgi:hypothetical protein
MPASEATKVIQTATLAVDTGSLDSTEKRMLELLAQNQGSAANMNITQDNNGQRRASYTLRVPQANLQTLVSSIGTLPDCTVRQKSLNSQDVTEEYIDIQARLENMNRQETRLRELLARANTVDEVLKVENELTRVRTQLDATTGKLKSLSDKIELSTLQLTVREVSGGYWSNYGAKLNQAFHDGVVAAGNMFLSIITVGIGFVPLAAVLWGIRKIWKRRKAAKAPTPPTTGA